MSTILENYIAHGSYESYLAMPERYRERVPYTSFRAHNEEFWERGMEASLRSRNARVAYLKETGAFFDYIAWANGRAIAIAKYRDGLEAKRRAMGDAEIVAASGDAVGSRLGGESWHGSDHKVLSAIISACSSSGMLYAAAEGLAARARVSRRTAFATRRKLESLGVLVRVSTGGRRADGHTAANRYFIRYNLLRDLLAIENRWESRYKGSELEARDRRRFFSALGFAHASQSDRQIRRIMASIREIAPKAHAKALAGFGGTVSGLIRGMDGKTRDCTLSRLLNLKRTLMASAPPILAARRQGAGAETWQELIPYDLKVFLESLPASKRESVASSVGSFAAYADQRRLASIAERYLRNLRSTLNR